MEHALTPIDKPPNTMIAPQHQEDFLDSRDQRESPVTSLAPHAVKGPVEGRAGEEVGEAAGADACTTPVGAQGEGQAEREESERDSGHPSQSNA
mmetsp:Transcript_19747/g.34231  ORF Transcript_19747/g.34231 Transcript_19747/m.34231 type:complete len:94 (-) Transcript_19747:309-590(-)